jgi:putative aminopeptidase FrvX
VTVPIPDLLRELLTAAGPSGHEEPVTKIWREAAGAFSEVTSDTLGTSFARVRAGEGAPTLALVGHIDEIGIAVTSIGEGGLISFVPIGGFSPEVLVGQRVRIAGKSGDVLGVVGRRRVEERPGGGGDKPRLDHSDLHVDVGAKSREEVEELIRIGDAGVWEGAPVELLNDRVISRALDNRLGAYVALEAARRVAEAGDAQVDVVAVAAVSEEVGLFGSRAAAFSLDPDIAIAIDVTHATDVPGGNPRLSGKVELGSGATIERGPMINAHVFELLVRTAEEEEIPHTFEVSTRATRTDADQIHVSRGGVPTGLVSIPLRYMHSPAELVCLDDLEAAIRLIVGFARRLTRDQSFVR